MNMWAIKHPTWRTDPFLHFTIRRTRTDSIKAFVGGYIPESPYANWKHWQRKGYRARKVTIEEYQ